MKQGFNNYVDPQGQPTEDLLWVYAKAIERMEKEGYDPSGYVAPAASSAKRNNRPSGTLLERMRERLDKPYNKKKQKMDYLDKVF